MARSDTRASLVAPLHCVAGWSAIGLRWAGVTVDEVWRRVIEPALVKGAVIRYVVFVGLDGYRSTLTVHDALDGTLLADRLDGEPLPAEHGAPVRLVRRPVRYVHRRLVKLPAPPLE